MRPLIITLIASLTLLGISRARADSEPREPLTDADFVAKGFTRPPGCDFALEKRFKDKEAFLAFIKELGIDFAAYPYGRPILPVRKVKRFHYHGYLICTEELDEEVMRDPSAIKQHLPYIYVSKLNPGPISPKSSNQPAPSVDPFATDNGGDKRKKGERGENKR